MRDYCFSDQVLQEYRNLLCQLFGGCGGEFSRGSLWIEWSTEECDHSCQLKLAFCYPVFAVIRLLF